MTIKPIQLMIAGAAKSGTTSLLQYLAQHPQIKTHRNPEFGFFLRDTEYQRGYQETFLREYGDNFNQDLTVIAKSSRLMYSATAIKRLWEHSPNVKIVVILRNPITRAYSDYWYSRLLGWENITSFEDALATESERLQQGWEQWYSCCYVYNGVYYPHLERLVNQFGREKIQVILFEDLHKQADEICQKILTDLDLNTPDFSVLAKQHNSAGAPRSKLVAQTFAKILKSQHPLKEKLRKSFPKSWADQIRNTIYQFNSKSFKKPPMREETKSWLQDQFRESNQKLSDLLAIDLTSWQ